MTPPTLALTEEQERCIQAAVDWFLGKQSGTNLNLSQTLTLGGFAGTGKTTVIKEIIRRLSEQQNDRVGVCAFTGKAASVLRRKGISDACTMHALMYTPHVDEKTHEVTFARNPFLDVKYVIVDEASMVNTDLNNDLLSFNKKILYVGDPGQLEPVGDNPNIMAKPQLMLTQIHRQAEKSRIIQLSLRARQNLAFSDEEGPEVTVAGRARVSMQKMLEVEQVICAYNTQRIKFNNMMRAELGHKGLLNVGEKVICLRNDRHNSVYNGQILVVTKLIYENDIVICCNLEDDIGKKWIAVPMLKSGLRGEFDPKTMRIPPKTCWFDYGYCITCHKSQGSEWKSVLVYEQGSTLWNMFKWRYTAVTRAAERLIYVR